MVPAFRTLLLALPALLLLGGEAHAVCNTTKLCEPGDNPCVINAACDINAGSTFDIRPRALVIQKKLTVKSGTAAVNIKAGSITIASTGDIEVTGVNGDFSIGGTINLFSDSTIVADSVGNTRSKIQAPGGFVGGNITFDAVGDVNLKTTVNVTATDNDGQGGEVDVISRTGSVTITDNGAGSSVNATGGTVDGSGGLVILMAGQNVTVDGLIDASNGDSFAEVLIEASEGSVTTTSKGGIKVNASTLGDGGIVDIYGAGNVAIGGNLEGKAAGQGGDFGEGGTGGELTVAGANVTFSATTTDFRGAGPDGDGGSIDVEATGNIVMDSNMLASVGGEGFGGDVSLVADGTIDVKKKIEVIGGDIGGTIDVFAVGNITLRAQMPATGKFDGGDIAVQGCGIDIQALAVLDTTAAPQPFQQSGSNLILGSGPITIAGTLKAAKSNTIRYKSTVPTVTGSILPAAIVTADPNLPCCLSCPVTTTSTTVTTSTSTSSTTLAPVTTTSTSLPATTTSTSLAPGTTTSTSLAPGTTTSTSLAPATTTSTSLAPATTTSTSLAPATTTSTSLAPGTTTSTSLAPATTTSSSTSSTSTSVPASTTSTSTAPTTSITSSTVATTSTTSSTVDTTSTSTTSSTTATTAPTSTTVTTSTLASTTSTSTSTTTTTLPLECYEQSLAPFDAVNCRLGTIGEELAVRTDAELGGKKSKNILTARIAKADKLIALAQQFLADGKPEKKVIAKLRTAGKQLTGFEKKIRAGISSGKLPADEADFWLDLSEGASAQISLLRSNVNAQ